MTVKDFAKEIKISVKKVLNLCKKLKINVSKETDILSKDDIALILFELEEAATLDDKNTSAGGVGDEGTRSSGKSSNNTDGSDFNIDNETFAAAYKCLKDAYGLLENGLGDFNELDNNALTLIKKGDINNNERLTNMTNECRNLQYNMSATIEFLSKMNVESANFFKDIFGNEFRESLLEIENEQEVLVNFDKLLQSGKFTIKNEYGYEIYDIAAITSWLSLNGLSDMPQMKNFINNISNYNDNLRKNRYEEITNLNDGKELSEEQLKILDELAFDMGYEGGYYQWLVSNKSIEDNYKEYNDNIIGLETDTSLLTRKFIEINASKLSNPFLSFETMAKTTDVGYYYIDGNGNKQFVYNMSEIPPSAKDGSVEAVTYYDICHDSKSYKALEKVDIDSNIFNKSSNYNDFYNSLLDDVKTVGVKKHALDDDNKNITDFYYIMLNNNEMLNTFLNVYSKNTSIMKSEDFSKNNVLSNESITELSNKVNKILDNKNIFMGEDGISVINVNNEDMMYLYMSSANGLGDFTVSGNFLVKSDGTKVKVVSNGNDIVTWDKISKVLSSSDAIIDGKKLNNQSNNNSFLITDSKLWNKTVTDFNYLNALNYLYNTGNINDVNEYVNLIMPSIDNRWVNIETMKDEYKADTAPVLSSVQSVLLGIPEGFSTFAYAFEHTITGAPVYKSRTYSSGDTMRARVSTNIRNSGVDGAGFNAFLYDVSMSMADNVFTSVVTAPLGLVGFGGGVGLGLAMSSFDNSYNDALSRGLDQNTAFAYSVSIAALEGATEQISFDNLVKVTGIEKFAEMAGLFKVVNKADADKAIENSLDNIIEESVMNKLKQWAISNGAAPDAFYSNAKKVYAVASQSASEGLEEYVSSSVGRMIDNLLQDKSNYSLRFDELLREGKTEVEAVQTIVYENFNEDLISTLSGMVSGGAMAGPTTMITNSTQSGKYLNSLELADYSGNYESAINQLLNWKGTPIDANILSARLTIDALYSSGKIDLEKKGYLNKIVNEFNSINSVNAFESFIQNENIEQLELLGAMQSRLNAMGENTDGKTLEELKLEFSDIYQEIINEGNKVIEKKIEDSKTEIIAEEIIDDLTILGEMQSRLNSIGVDTADMTLDDMKVKYNDIYEEVVNANNSITEVDVENVETNVKTNNNETNILNEIGQDNIEPGDLVQLQNAVKKIFKKYSTIEERTAQLAYLIAENKMFGQDSNKMALISMIQNLKMEGKEASYDQEVLTSLISGIGVVGIKQEHLLTFINKTDLTMEDVKKYNNITDDSLSTLSDTDRNIKLSQAVKNYLDTLINGARKEYNISSRSRLRQEHISGYMKKFNENNSDKSKPDYKYGDLKEDNSGNNASEGIFRKHINDKVIEEFNGLSKEELQKIAKFLNKDIIDVTASDYKRFSDIRGVLSLLSRKLPNGFDLNDEELLYGLDTDAGVECREFLNRQFLKDKSLIVALRKAGMNNIEKIKDIGLYNIIDAINQYAYQYIEENNIIFEEGKLPIELLAAKDPEFYENGKEDMMSILRDKYDGINDNYSKITSKLASVARKSKGTLLGYKDRKDGIIEHSIKDKDSAVRKVYSKWLNDLNEYGYKLDIDNPKNALGEYQLIGIHKSNKDQRFIINKDGFICNQDGELVIVDGENRNVKLDSYVPKDLLRYTITSNSKNYVSTVISSIKNLELDGYKIIGSKFSWPGSFYQGINLTFEKDSQIFELQFHTEESFYAKDNGTHMFYEIKRNKVFDDLPVQDVANYAQMLMQSQVEVPANSNKFSLINDFVEYAINYNKKISLGKLNEIIGEINALDELVLEGELKKNDSDYSQFMNEFLDRFSEDGEFSLGDLLSEYFEISDRDMGTYISSLFHNNKFSEINIRDGLSNILGKDKIDSDIKDKYISNVIDFFKSFKNLRKDYRFNDAFIEKVSTLIYNNQEFLERLFNNKINLNTDVVVFEKLVSSLKSLYISSREYMGKIGNGVSTGIKSFVDSLGKLVSESDKVVVNDSFDAGDMKSFFESEKEIAEFFGDSNLYLLGVILDKNRSKKIKLSFEEITLFRSGLYNGDVDIINKALSYLNKNEIELYNKIKSNKDSLYRKWISRLSDNEKYALRNYTKWFGSMEAYEVMEMYGYDSDGRSSVPITELMRHGFVDGNKYLDLAIEKFGVLPNQIITYRGVSLNALTSQFGEINKDNLGNLIGKIYTDKAYMSTSLIERIARPVGGEKLDVILKITVPNNSNYGAFNESQANLNYNQLEFLIKRNSTSLIENAYLNEDGKIVVEMTLFDETLGTSKSITLNDGKVDDVKNINKNIVHNEEKQDEGKKSEFDFDQDVNISMFRDSNELIEYLRQKSLSKSNIEWDKKVLSLYLEFIKINGIDGGLGYKDIFDVGENYDYAEIISNSFDDGGSGRSLISNSRRRYTKKQLMEMQRSNWDFRITLNNSSSIETSKAIKYVNVLVDECQKRNIDIRMKNYWERDAIILYCYSDQLHSVVELLEDLTNEKKYGEDVSSVTKQFGPRKPFTIGLNNDSYYGISMYSNELEIGQSPTFYSDYGYVKSTYSEYSTEFLKNAYEKLLDKYDGDNSKITVDEFYNEILKYHKRYMFGDENASENIPLWMNRRNYKELVDLGVDISFESILDKKNNDFVEEDLSDIDDDSSWLEEDLGVIDEGNISLKASDFVSKNSGDLNARIGSDEILLSKEIEKTLVDSGEKLLKPVEYSTDDIENDLITTDDESSNVGNKLQYLNRNLMTNDIIVSSDDGNITFEIGDIVCTLDKNSANKILRKYGNLDLNDSSVRSQFISELRSVPNVDIVFKGEVVNTKHNSDRNLRRINNKTSIIDSEIVANTDISLYERLKNIVDNGEYFSITSELSFDERMSLLNEMSENNDIWDFFKVSMKSNIKFWKNLFTDSELITIFSNPVENRNVIDLIQGSYSLNLEQLRLLAGIVLDNKDVSVKYKQSFIMNFSEFDKSLLLDILVDMDFEFMEEILYSSDELFILEYLKEVDLGTIDINSLKNLVSTMLSDKGLNEFYSIIKGTSVEDYFVQKVESNQISDDMISGLKFEGRRHNSGIFEEINRVFEGEFDDYKKIVISSVIDLVRMEFSKINEFQIEKCIEEYLINEINIKFGILVSEIKNTIEYNYNLFVSEVGQGENFEKAFAKYSSSVVELVSGKYSRLMSDITDINSYFMDNLFEMLYKNYNELYSDMILNSKLDNIKVYLKGIIAKQGDKLINNYYLNIRYNFINNMGIMNDILSDVLKNEDNDSLRKKIGIQFFASSDGSSSREIVDDIKYIIKAHNDKYPGVDVLSILRNYCNPSDMVHYGHSEYISSNKGARQLLRKYSTEQIKGALSEFDDIRDVKNASQYMASISKNQIYDNIKNVVLDIVSGKLNDIRSYDILVNVNSSLKKLPSRESYKSFVSKFDISRCKIWEQYKDGNERKCCFVHYISHNFNNGDVSQRLYINAEYETTFKFLEIFANKCERRGIPFCFKTAFLDYESKYRNFVAMESSLTRSESAVIYSSDRYIAQYTDICREIKNEHPEFEFYNPPVATASIDGWLGYGAEPINEICKQKNVSASFNSVRSQILDLSISKGIKNFVITYANQIINNNKTGNDLLIDSLYEYIVNTYKINDKNISDSLYRELFSRKEFYLDFLKQDVKGLKILNHIISADDVRMYMFNNYLVNSDVVYNFINDSIKDISVEYGVDPDNFAINLSNQKRMELLNSNLKNNPNDIKVIADIKYIIESHDKKYVSGDALSRLKLFVNPKSNNYGNYNIISSNLGARNLLKKYTPEDIAGYLYRFDSKSMSNNRYSSNNGQGLSGRIGIQFFADKGRASDLELNNNTILSNVKSDIDMSSDDGFIQITGEFVRNHLLFTKESIDELFDSINKSRYYNSEYRKEEMLFGLIKAFKNDEYYFDIFREDNPIAREFCDLYYANSNILNTDNDIIRFVSDYVSKRTVPGSKVSLDMFSIVDIFSPFNNNKYGISKLRERLMNQFFEKIDNVTKKISLSLLKMVEDSVIGEVNGAVNYSIISEFIFKRYEGMESRFEKNFGFPMYLDGGFNKVQLISDMFISVVNSQYEGKSIVEIMNHLRNGDLTFNLDYISKYLIDNGIIASTDDFVCDRLFNSRRDIDGYGDINKIVDSILSDVDTALSKGSQVIISLDNIKTGLANSIDLRDIDGKLVSRLYNEDSLSVLGITNDGRLIVNLNNVRCYIDIRNMITFGKTFNIDSVYLDISSLEVVDTKKKDLSKSHIDDNKLTIDNFNGDFENRDFNLGGFIIKGYEILDFISDDSNINKLLNESDGIIFGDYTAKDMMYCLVKLFQEYDSNGLDVKTMYPYVSEIYNEYKVNQRKNLLTTDSDIKNFVNKFIESRVKVLNTKNKVKNQVVGMDELVKYTSDNTDSESDWISDEDFGIDEEDNDGYELKDGESLSGRIGIQFFGRKSQQNQEEVNNDMDNIPHKNIWESKLKDDFTYLSTYEELISYIKKYGIFDIIIRDRQYPSDEIKCGLDNIIKRSNICTILTDGSHIISIFDSIYYGKTIFINSDFYKKYGNQLKKDLKDVFFDKIKDSRYSIDIPDILIDDKFIDLMISSEDFRYKTISISKSIGNQLSEEQIDKIKKAHLIVNYGLQQISTDKVIGSYSIKQLNNKRTIDIYDYPTYDEIQNFIYLRDDCVVKFSSALQKDERLFFEKLKDIFEILKKHNKTYNIKIKVENRELLRQYGLIDYENINLIITSDSYDYSKDEYILEEKVLNDLVRPIKDSSLSPYEKYLAVYNIVKQFKPYKENYDDKNQSRYLRYILNNDYIVCRGYATLLKTLLDKIEVPVVEIGALVDVSKYNDNLENVPIEYVGHARNLIKIDDDKYNIHGYFVVDSTWDNDMDKDLYLHSTTTFDNRKGYRRLERIADQDLLFDFHSFEDFSEKINFYLKHKFNRDASKSYSENIIDTYSELYNKILDLLIQLDYSKYQELYGKYNNLIDEKLIMFKDKKISSLKEVEDVFSEFLTDYANYIIPLSNQNIDNNTIFEAASNVKKQINKFTDEDLENWKNVTIDVNKKIGEYSFPYVYNPTNKRKNYLETRRVYFENSSTIVSSIQDDVINIDNDTDSESDWISDEDFGIEEDDDNGY